MSSKRSMHIRCRRKCPVFGEAQLQIFQVNCPYTPHTCNDRHIENLVAMKSLSFVFQVAAGRPTSSNTFKVCFVLLWHQGLKQGLMCARQTSTMELITVAIHFLPKPPKGTRPCTKCHLGTATSKCLPGGDREVLGQTR